MIIKYLSVGQWSWFSYQQVALNVLFHMRYDSMSYSKKQPSDKQRGWDTSCFHPTQPLFCFCFAHWRSPGVCIHPSSFWSANQSFPWASQATIPHMKEDSNTFHMTPITLIFIDKIFIFQCQSPYKSNSPCTLVTLLCTQSQNHTILSWNGLPRPRNRSVMYHSS